MYLCTIQVQNCAIVNKMSDLDNVGGVNLVLGQLEFRLEVVALKPRVVIGWVCQFGSDRHWQIVRVFKRNDTGT